MNEYDAEEAAALREMATQVANRAADHVPPEHRPPIAQMAAQVLDVWTTPPSSQPASSACTSPPAPVPPVVTEEAKLLDWYEANPHRVSRAINPGGDDSVWYAIHPDLSIHACTDLRHAIRSARDAALTAALRPEEVDRG